MNIDFKPLFLVRGYTSFIDSHREWIAGAHTTKDAADRHAELAQAAADELRRKHNNGKNRVFCIEQPTRYDIQCCIGDDFIRYSVVETTLFCTGLPEAGVFAAVGQFTAAPASDEEPVQTQMAAKLRAALGQ